MYHSSFYCIISSPNRIRFNFWVMASSKNMSRESQNLFLALSLKKIVGSNIWVCAVVMKRGWGLRSDGIPFHVYWTVWGSEAGWGGLRLLSILENTSYYFWGLGAVCKRKVWKSLFLFPCHNFTLTCWSRSSSDDTPSRTSSTVRITHSVPSSLESHLSSSVWFSVFRAFRRPKIWLVNCGPTPPSARRDAIPTTEPKARLRFPWSRSFRLLLSE